MIEILPQTKKNYKIFNSLVYNYEFILILIIQFRFFEGAMLFIALYFSIFSCIHVLYPKIFRWWLTYISYYDLKFIKKFKPFIKIKIYPSIIWWLKNIIAFISYMYSCFLRINELSKKIYNSISRALPFEILFTLIFFYLFYISNFFLR